MTKIRKRFNQKLSDVILTVVFLYFFSLSNILQEHNKNKIRKKTRRLKVFFCNFLITFLLIKDHLMSNYDIYHCIRNLMHISYYSKMVKLQINCKEKTLSTKKTRYVCNKILILYYISYVSIIDEICYQYQPFKIFLT